MQRCNNLKRMLAFILIRFSRKIKSIPNSRYFDQVFNCLKVLSNWTQICISCLKSLRKSITKFAILKNSISIMHIESVFNGTEKFARTASTRGISIPRALTKTMVRVHVQQKSWDNVRTLAGRLRNDP